MPQQQFQPLEQNNSYSMSHSYPPSSIHYPPVPNHPMNPIIPTAPTKSYNIYPVLPTAPPGYHPPIVGREMKPKTDTTYTDNYNRTTLTHKSHITHNSHIFQNDDVFCVFECDDAMFKSSPSKYSKSSSDSSTNSLLPRPKYSLSSTSKGQEKLTPSVSITSGS